MGSYDSQYESYYANIQGNKFGGTYNNKTGGYGNKRNKYITRFVQELAGVFILSAVIMFCRVVKMPQTNEVYNYMKKSVNYNIDYKQIWADVNKIQYKDIENYVNKYTKKVNKMIKDGMNFQNKAI